MSKDGRHPRILFIGCWKRDYAGRKFGVRWVYSLRWAYSVMLGVRMRHGLPHPRTKHWSDVDEPRPSTRVRWAYEGTLGVNRLGVCASNL